MALKVTCTSSDPPTAADGGRDEPVEGRHMSRTVKMELVLNGSALATVTGLPPEVVAGGWFFAISGESEQISVESVRL